MAWDVTRTVRVRLDVPDDRKNDLHATNQQFRIEPLSGHGDTHMTTA